MHHLHPAGNFQLAGVAWKVITWMPVFLTVTDQPARRGDWRMAQSRVRRILERSISRLAFQLTVDALQYRAVPPRRARQGLVCHGYTSARFNGDASLAGKSGQQSLVSLHRMARRSPCDHLDHRQSHRSWMRIGTTSNLSIKSGLLIRLFEPTLCAFGVVRMIGLPSAQPGPPCRCPVEPPPGQIRALAQDNFEDSSSVLEINQDRLPACSSKFHRTLQEFGFNSGLMSKVEVKPRPISFSLASGRARRSGFISERA